jgi:hypothetical protein
MELHGEGCEDREAALSVEIGVRPLLNLDLAVDCAV